MTLVLDDARSYLAATRETYDVIISQPSNPWMSGVANLFTRDFFRIVRGALAPGGRLLQWMQLYSLDPPSLASIVAALRAEFAYVYGFADFAGGPDVLFLAMDRPLAREDLPRWEELPESVRSDLRRVGNFSTADLWSLLRVTPADIDDFVATVPMVNTDDNMFIELGTPWMIYGDTFVANWLALAPDQASVLALLGSIGEPLGAEEIEVRRRWRGPGQGDDRRQHHSDDELPPSLPCSWFASFGGRAMRSGRRRDRGGWNSREWCRWRSPLSSTEDPESL